MGLEYDAGISLTSTGMRMIKNSNNITAYVVGVFYLKSMETNRQASQNIDQLQKHEGCMEKGILMEEAQHNPCLC